MLGRDVRSPTDEDMGHIVDVIVDHTGTVRAAVIDFGGFLGVGSRKIVVDWNALHFGRVNDKSDNITAHTSTTPTYGPSGWSQGGGGGKPADPWKGIAPSGSPPGLNGKSN